MHVSNMADQHFAQQQLHDVNKKAAKAALELQIHKRLVTETRLRDNYNITKKLQLLAVRTNWAHSSIAGINAQKEMRVNRSIDEKLRYANIVTLLERRQRLRHLYQHDLARFEQELALKGLAIHKEY